MLPWRVLPPAGPEGAHWLWEWVRAGFPTAADLTGLDLGGAVLSGADFSVTLFTGARLRGARVLGAVLLDTDLRGADLAGAELRENLFEVILDDRTRVAGLTGTVFGPATPTASDGTRRSLAGSALEEWIRARGGDVRVIEPRGRPRT
ncbi:pentapeptide repeat-containing protein [Streptomyces sp. NPDC054854]